MQLFGRCKASRNSPAVSKRVPFFFPTCGPLIPRFMCPAVTAHPLLTFCSLFLIGSCLRKLNGSISCLTSRRLHVSDSCWFLSGGRRVFCCFLGGFLINLPSSAEKPASVWLWSLVCEWESSSRFARHTNVQANHADCDTTPRLRELSFTCQQIVSKSFFKLTFFYFWLKMGKAPRNPSSSNIYIYLGGKK